MLVAIARDRCLPLELIHNDQCTAYCRYERKHPAYDGTLHLRLERRPPGGDGRKHFGTTHYIGRARSAAWSRRSSSAIPRCIGRPSTCVY